MNKVQAKQKGKRKVLMGALAVLVLLGSREAAASSDAFKGSFGDAMSFTAAAAAWEHSAIRHEGTIWAWGYNGFGQLAWGTVSSPAMAMTLPAPLPASSGHTPFLLDMQSPGRGSISGRVGRILLEGLVGVGLGIGSTALGARLAADYEPPMSLILPTSLLLLGSSVGVAAVGGALDGRGSFGATVLGSTLGFAVPLIIGTGILAANGCSSPSVNSCAGLKPLAISLLVLPTVGAIIGYEISAPRVAEPSRRAPTSHQPSRVIPTLTPAQQGIGATLGLAGTL